MPTKYKNGRRRAIRNRVSRLAAVQGPERGLVAEDESVVFLECRSVDIPGVGLYERAQQAANGSTTPRQTMYKGLSWCQVNLKNLTKEKKEDEICTSSLSSSTIPLTSGIEEAPQLLLSVIPF